MILSSVSLALVLNLSISFKFKLYVQLFKTLLFSDFFKFFQGTNIL